MGKKDKNKPIIAEPILSVVAWEKRDDCGCVQCKPEIGGVKCAYYNCDNKRRHGHSHCHIPHIPNGSGYKQDLSKTTSVWRFRVRHWNQDTFYDEYLDGQKENSNAKDPS